MRCPLRRSIAGGDGRPPLRSDLVVNHSLGWDTADFGAVEILKQQQGDNPQ